jgi:bifunctional non-homologous end joining protein LigD
VRSRRGWDMTERVGFLAQLPLRAVLDGELVALDEDGKPDFPLICKRLLRRRFYTLSPSTRSTSKTMYVSSVAAQPYSERRRILEDLRLDAPQWRTPHAFDDGEALRETVCNHELEGVVAKPRRSRYVPGERGWIKTKNRD